MPIINGDLSYALQTEAMPLIHGLTTDQRDRLVSHAFAKLDHRTTDTVAQAEVFGARQATPCSIVPEHVGFQVLPIYDHQQKQTPDMSKHFVIKGIYSAPLLHDYKKGCYISIAQPSSGGRFVIDLANHKPEQADWIVDYQMFVWRLDSPKSKFLGYSISESLRAAQLVHEERCPPMERMMKVIFVLLVAKKDDEEVQRIGQGLRKCLDSPYPLVTVTEEEITTQ